jgi:hypothetical protein
MSRGTVGACAARGNLDAGYEILVNDGWMSKGIARWMITLVITILTPYLNQICARILPGLARYESPSHLANAIHAAVPAHPWAAPEGLYCFRPDQPFKRFSREPAELDHAVEGRWQRPVARHAAAAPQETTPAG